MKKSHDPSQWNDDDWRQYNKPCPEWNEVEWVNVYKLYSATNLWELDDSLEFEDFKQKVRNDSEFAKLHRVKPGMEDPDYNPWSTG